MDVLGLSSKSKINNSLLDYFLIGKDSDRDTSMPRWTSSNSRVDAKSYVCGSIISIGYWSANAVYKVTTFSKHVFFKLSAMFFFFQRFCKNVAQGSFRAKFYQQLLCVVPLLDISI